MNWLALTPAEVAAVWTSLGALALWLYLHHRRPVHRQVSTLRFWASMQPVMQPRRRRLEQPWALLAQLVFLLLLVLALANLRWGAASEGRSVVIILDTSIWSQMRPAGEPSWIDRERAEALRLVNSLPAGDLVMVLPAAEPGAAPILPFTIDRVALRRAIAAAQFSSAAADIPRTLEAGRAALAGSRSGLLVYVGPGMLDEQQSRSLDEFRTAIETPGGPGGQPQFLVRLVGDQEPIQNRGIMRLSLRRDAAQPERWHLLTQVKNYSDTQASVVLKLSVSGQPLDQKTLMLAPNELDDVESEFVWDKGGLLQAEISPPDALGADNRAFINIPAFRVVRVAVFTGNSTFAKDLMTVLSSNPYLQTEIVAPGMSAHDSPDVAIYQGSSLPAHSDYNSIWFLNGQALASSHALRITDWNPHHPVTRWVRTHDISVRNPASLDVLPTDTVLASVEGGPPVPLILAREQDGRRLLIIGFDPHNSNLPLQPAFPLLMAAGIEWMTHSVDETADAPITGELNLPSPVSRIISPSGKDLAFARKGPGVHFLATETGMYRLIAPNGERTIAVNAPLLPAQRLKPTAPELASVESEPLWRAGWNLWRWLVVLGMAALWLEWWLYYSIREKPHSVAGIPETPGDSGSQNMNLELEQNPKQADLEIRTLSLW